MTASKIAKILLFISCGANPTLAVQKIPCGVYKATGTLGTNEAGQTILRVAPESRTPIEILALGGDTEAKVSLLGSRIQMQFYVPRPSQYEAIGLIHSISLASSGRWDRMTKIKSRRCGQIKEYLKDN